MAGDAHDRTEQPTPRRLEEARKKGQVPRSPELSAAAVVLMAGAGLHFLGRYMGGQLTGIMRAGLSLSREQSLDETLAMAGFSASMSHALLACLPLLGLTALAALAAPMAIGGWNLSPGVLAPDFTRLNPASGFGRMFSTRSAVDLGKAFAKFLVVAVIATLVIKHKSLELMGLGSEPIGSGLAHAATLTGNALLLLAAGLGLIAAVDVPWQLYQHTKNLKMTRDEVRQELRESDGSPEMKGRIRKAQQDAARRKMMHEVPKADVVVTNPTHFAVALRYDDKRMRAPIVVAKGQDLIAARIREIAAEHSVPIFEAPPLARVLYRNVDLGGEVPTSLYQSVAQVLTYIYQLKTAKRHGMAPPSPPTLDPNIESTKH
jgi:flagellar biosynthesis protein FlhB